ncbi:MAG: P-II family nitrogen regulator [Clostridia bacterium]|jgi:nitrogen regulatory protein PII|nr:P-II family nitrogen regulator [Clostridia bacterium]
MHKDINRGIIKLLVTIVDRGNGPKIAEIYKQEHLYFHFLCFGLGTASSEILDYLGIGETEKDVVITLTPHGKIPALLALVSEKMKLKKPGHGIAFTLPISGIGNIMSQLLTQEERTNMENEISKMEATAKYTLILAIVNRGYDDMVMAAAKEAGATGGTLLDARGMGYENAEKFLGISIQAEKTILFILCNKADKHAIMQAINQSAGIKTEARGIILSLAVEDVLGLRSPG